MKVSRGRVPRLREFAADWGRDLLPAEVLASPPDVLVVIPHEFVHQLPLHLVLADDGRALPLHSGIAYCGSIALFCRLTRRRRPRAQRVGVAAGVDVLDDGPDRFAASQRTCCAGSRPTPASGGRLRPASSTSRHRTIRVS